MKKSFFIVMLISFFIASLCGPLLLNAQDTNKKGLISVDFRETDIKDALRLLAKQYNLNIIISEDVEGIITTQLSDVTVEEAIDAIVTINGYAYTKKDNLIKVTTPEEAEREPAVTRIFRLNNASAADIKEAFKNVISDTGTIEVDERSNSLVVTDNPKIVSKFEDLIKDIDQPTPQVLIEAKVIETVLSDADKLGINWTTQVTATGSSRPVTFPFSRNDKGGEWYPKGDTSADAGDNTGVFAADPGSSFPLALPSNFSFGTLDFTQFQAVLEILESRSKTTVLSNPKIVTLDNKEAKVLIGTRLPIPIYERNEATGTFEITGYDEEETGVTLKVTPHISPGGGRIRLKIYPEVSSITGYTGPNDERPIIATREAETEVQIKDGQTVVIGGLIKEEKVKTVRRIPILGYIPIIELLFKKKEDTTEKTDLLIFITAHILTDEKARYETDKAIKLSGSEGLFKDRFTKEFKPEKKAAVESGPSKREREKPFKGKR